MDRLGIEFYSQNVFIVRMNKWINLLLLEKKDFSGVNAVLIFKFNNF